MQTTGLVLSALLGNLICGQQGTRIDAPVCGANCLAVAAAYVDDVPTRLVHDLLPPQRAPFSLYDLEQAARTLGLAAVDVHWTDKHEVQFPAPAILHVRAQSASPVCDHFIVCVGELDGLLCIVDYPRRVALVPRDKILANWEGDALYVDAAVGNRIASLQEHSNTRRYRVLAGFAVCLLTATLLVKLHVKKSRKR